MPLPSDSDSWRRSSVTVKALALAIRSRYSCSSSITVCDGQAFRVAAGGDTCNLVAGHRQRCGVVVAPGIAGQAAAPDVELGGDPACGPIARAVAARFDGAQHPAAAAEVCVQGPTRLAARLLAQHLDQLETRRRRGLHLRDLRGLLDQQLVGEARLVGEALDLVEVRDPGVAQGVGDAQARARRAVGAGHRIGRDREAPLMRLMGLIGGAGGEQRGSKRRPAAQDVEARRMSFALALA